MKPWGEQSREGNYVQKALIEGKVGGMAHVATVIKRLKAEGYGATKIAKELNIHRDSVYRLLKK